MKKTSNISYYQQGDVILIKREGTQGIPAKPSETVTVQEGEHTGHAHRFVEQGGNVQMFIDGSNKFLSVTEQSTLTHEEHLPITIEKGDYEVRIVRQKDPFTKLVSRVVD